MDQERVERVIESFRSAESAIADLIGNAGKLEASAEAIRDTDATVKALAEALGLASSRWAEVGEEVRRVTAEIEAATRLLQRAEPDEVRSALDALRVSFDRLNASTKSVGESFDRVQSQFDQLSSRTDSLAESVTSLRQAVVAKLDLQQATMTSLQSDLEKRNDDLKVQVASSSTDTVRAIRLAMYVSGVAALFALAAVVLVLVN